MFGVGMGFWSGVNGDSLFSFFLYFGFYVDARWRWWWVVPGLLVWCSRWVRREGGKVVISFFSCINDTNCVRMMEHEIYLVICWWMMVKQRGWWGGGFWLVMDS